MTEPTIDPGEGFELIPREEWGETKTSTEIGYWCSNRWWQFEPQSSNSCLSQWDFEAYRRPIKAQGWKLVSDGLPPEMTNIEAVNIETKEQAAFLWDSKIRSLRAFTHWKPTRFSEPPIKEKEAWEVAYLKLFEGHDKYPDGGPEWFKAGWDAALKTKPNG